MINIATKLNYLMLVRFLSSNNYAYFLGPVAHAHNYIPFVFSD